MNKTISRAAALWLCLYTAVCYANTTLAQDLAAFDWASLGLACAAGLLGGAGRTLITMISFRALVGNLKYVLAKDLMVALIGGGFALLCVEGWNEMASAMHEIDLVRLPRVTRGWRILIILLAGASRGRWLGTVDQLATAAIDNVRAKIRNGAPPPPPTSAVMPLPETKP